MIITEQIIEVKINKKNKEHFLKKGYKSLENGDTLSVSPKDLPIGSTKKLKCICDNCNTTFNRSAKSALVSKRHFCKNQCKAEYQKGKPSPLNTRVRETCSSCKKEILIKKYRSMKLRRGEQENVFCSRECQSKWRSENPSKEVTGIEKTCLHCGNNYKVSPYRQQTSKYCSSKCRSESKNKKIKTACGICNKELFVVPSKIKKSKSGLVFCSNKCVGMFNKNKREQKIKKTCKICNNVYFLRPSLARKSVTCSKECQNIWQSQYLTGKNANRYNKDFPIEKRITQCEYCKKKFILKSPYLVAQKTKNGKKTFCSKDCRQIWYSTVWSQREEWKKQSQIRAVNILSSGLISKTNSKCQIIINGILKSMNIDTINEHNLKYFTIDNYLPEYNLMIEVMGTYWHTDPRKYKQINYKTQYDRIINDKRKRLAIKSLEQIDILYLWEMDILNDPNLIKTLIKEYIINNGELKNYHSFNYEISKKSLSLKKNIILPYMEFDKNKLDMITNLSVHKKKSRKQIEKWVSFFCDHCGKETERLKSRYKKTSNHFCCQDCQINFKRNTLS
ncbi:hypothetical protein [Bacillus paralicheniformis]|uniref:hypothetical protein n=1 Tax=Bacillus paralicheniformis TaxID=1648923 RepID=UPI000BA64B88|nr:hypothetical protein [Bacillus paralicheniformis]PAC96519.1 hypothetical protein CHH86_14325 [Bacillus paralicheniformis]